MNKLFAGLIDDYALWDLHKKRSSRLHFCNLYTSCSDINSFFPAPTIPQVEFKKGQQAGQYECGTFTYLSGITTGIKENDICSGVYSRSRTPNNVSLVLLHGWRMDTLKSMKNLFDGLMEHGYDLYYLALPYHFTREPKESEYSGELFVTSHIGRTLESVRQTISDVRALIRFLKQKGQRVILMGVSFGGLMGNLASAVESDIDGLVSIFYANSLAYSMFYSKAGKYIKRDLVDNGFTFEELEKVWSIIDPSRYKPLVHKENILLLSGKHDKYVLIEDTDRLWENWGRPQRIVYNIGHAGIVLYRKRIYREILKFLQGRFK